MSNDIKANKQTISEFLSSAGKNKFLIPDYQRPYSWEKEQIEKFFNDIKEFILKTPKEETYFIGCIVSFNNEKGYQEIIDGQQRITTLFLLLRAFYSKLEEEETNNSNERINSFKKMISPCLWELLDDVVIIPNKEKTLIESEVITDKEKNIFNNIMVNGKFIEKSKDKYSVNYLLIQQLIKDFINENPSTSYDYIKYLLRNVIIINIKTDNQDTALDIFTTLNDRGKQLDDSDIFKAKIYKNSNEKDNIITLWKELNENSKDAKENLNTLFYYYMFYLRAKDNDDKSTTPGLRKYYSKDDYKKLYNKDLFEDLNKILDLFCVINTHKPIDDQNWSTNIDILKILDILKEFPNEWWKYPTLIYYLHNKDEQGFDKNFHKFLRKLCAEILIMYISGNSLNIKNYIMKLNKEIINTNSLFPKFNFPKHNEYYKERIVKDTPPKIVKLLLLILTYNNKNQNNLLEDNWQIEHIFPRKYDNNYFKYDKTIIDKKIECIGNKTPLSKKLNIQANNNFFTEKKKKYEKSNCEITKELSKQTDWDLEQIDQRNVEIKAEIITTINKWIDEYKEENDSKIEATPEELEQIKNLRAKGLIK